MGKSNLTGGNAAALGGVAAERYIAACYHEYSGAKSYTFQSHVGRVARPSCKGYTKITKANPDADISPDNVATLTPSRLSLSDGAAARGLNVDLWSLPNGVTDEYDGVRLTRRVGKAVLDGTETWGAVQEKDGFIRFDTSLSGVSGDSEAVNCTSDLFEAITFPLQTRLTQESIISWFDVGSNRPRTDIAIKTSRINGWKDSLIATEKRALFLAWLAANPVTILYELAEPVVTYVNLDIPLSDTNTITSTDAVLPCVTLREIAGPTLRAPYAMDAEMLAGVPAEQCARINPNLLINGDLQHPVNQRGDMEYSSTGYMIDGWFLNRDITARITDAGLEISPAAGNANPTIFQKIEYSERYFGKTLTFSVLYGNEVYSATGTLPTTLVSGNYGQCQTPFGIIRIQITVNFGVIAVISTTPGTTETYRAAKLELGDHFTGWPEYDAATELAKCQRRYVRLAGDYTYQGYGQAFTTTIAAMQIDLPVSLRATPVVKVNENVLISSDTTLLGNGKQIKGIKDVSVAPNGVKFNATVESGLTRGAFCIFNLRLGGYIELDANL